jgi:hypothetical protein
VARHGANLEVMSALGNEQRDEPLALHLQREHAVEFQRGGEQHHGAHCLAQQLLNGGRIVLVLTQREPGLREPHGVAADRMPLEYETPDEIELGHPCALAG